MVERRHYTYVTNDEGGRKKKLDELPEIVDNFIYKITVKRLNMIEPAILNAIIPEANKLFRMVVVNSMDVQVPSPEISPYLSKGWRRLSQKWLEAKKPITTFWYGYKDGGYDKEGNSIQHLKDYLAGLDAMAIFGIPQIKTAKNLRARGYQRATFSINPYPNRREELRSNMSADQYKKLFVPRRDGKTNEEDRPLISPAIKFMIENHLRKVVSKVLKEIMRTGEEVKFDDLRY